MAEKAFHADAVQLNAVRDEPVQPRGDSPPPPAVSTLGPGEPIKLACGTAPSCD